MSRSRRIDYEDEEGEDVEVEVKVKEEEVEEEKEAVLTTRKCIPHNLADMLPLHFQVGRVLGLCMLLLPPLLILLRCIARQPFFTVSGPRSTGGPGRARSRV